MHTDGLANAEGSPALFPPGLQSRTSVQWPWISIKVRVNEVAFVLDAAEVLDRVVFAVASRAALHASSAARSTIRAAMVSGAISRMATVPSLIFCLTKLGLPGFTKSTPW